MKKIKNGEAIQTNGVNVAFQMAGKANPELLTASVTKTPINVKTLVAVPPQAGDFNDFVQFKDADENATAGLIDTTAEITIVEEGTEVAYYAITDTTETFVDEYFAVLVSEHDDFVAGDTQNLHYYRVVEGAASQFGLIDKFGDDTEGTSTALYGYAEGDVDLYSNDFLGEAEGEEAVNARSTASSTIYVTDDGFVYLASNGTATTCSVSGEMTDTSDWEGYLRYYVETAEGASVAGEGYVYIEERKENEAVYVKGNTTSTGTQGAVSSSAITDIDIYQSVNGVDFIKNKDVASAIEQFTNVPKGMYWKLVCALEFDGWISE